MNLSPLEHTASLHIGVVDFVSPDEIKVSIDIKAPAAIAANAGVPRAFPRINSYVLISTEAGFIVCQIEWISVERSFYPKSSGKSDFDLIDLPFPLRKMKVNPLGVLKKDRDNYYRFSRGVQTFPSIGESVLIPTDAQLRAIVESGSNRHIKIGTSPLAANADICVDPNRLFGRHLAVLGNTGSGKSCTVAGLIQWSLEAAEKRRNENTTPDTYQNPNARFIILDPNGEYAKVFGKKGKVFKVNDADNPLQVPLWFWNSAEWSSFTQASAKAQRPLLKRALRELRAGKLSVAQTTIEEKKLSLRRYLSSNLISIYKDYKSGAIRTEETKFGNRLWAISEDLRNKIPDFPLIDLNSIKVVLDNALSETYKSFQKDGKTVEYFKAFSEQLINPIIASFSSVLNSLGGIIYQDGPDEDMPIPFKGADFADHLQILAEQENVSQYLDFLIMRIRTMLADNRMKAIIGDDIDITLDDWLNKYIGMDNAEEGCITVIDLSLVPAEIVHIITAVIARMTFEALQRYRKLNGVALPTVLVMEEAHNFIKRYRDDSDNHNSADICCQMFEKIAREGRKFGLGLVLSSQRPSELSPTVLSQCNTFILHRISNDRDQELIHRLVPDNLKGLLRELPSLPSQQAILLGWASELPVLVKMNDLSKSQRPQSDDPDYWNVWSGFDNENKEIERPVNWNNIIDDWQSSI